MTFISLNFYQIFSVLRSRRRRVCGEGGLVHSFLGQREELPPDLPLLAVSQGRYSARTDSDDVVTRKVGWFAPQCRTGSEICQYHRVSRQDQVVAEWFLELSL